MESVSKAIAGGLVGVVVAEVARYGFHPGPQVLDAVSVLVTALVGYAVGHVGVWLAPANK